VIYQSNKTEGSVRLMKDTCPLVWFFSQEPQTEPRAIYFDDIVNKV
jgi:hypothetical protein